MPIYEYRCNKCQRRVNLYMRNVASAPQCPQCGSEELSRLFSTFAVRGTYKDIYEDILSDGQLTNGLMRNDPKALADWNKRMSRGMEDNTVAPEYEGGGLEVAIRCHSLIATKNALFQFPEITLGILPGIGGCIVPYRKWPDGAALFNEMICFGRPIKAKEAADIGMVTRIADDYSELIKGAVEEVNNLQGRVKRISDAKVDIPEITMPDEPMAGKQPLSKEAASIVLKTVKDGAAADSFAEALEIGYKGFGEIACTDAAKEGISAFLEKRKPEFKK